MIRDGSSPFVLPDRFGSSAKVRDVRRDQRVRERPTATNRNRWDWTRINPSVRVIEHWFTTAQTTERRAGHVRTFWGLHINAERVGNTRELPRIRDDHREGLHLVDVEPRPVLA